MIYYETTYQAKHKGKIQTLKYRTKSHTSYHEFLRKQYHGRTVKYDTSIEWVFGTWAEIVK